MLQNCDRIVTTQTAQCYNFVTKFQKASVRQTAHKQVPTAIFLCEFPVKRSGKQSYEKSRK
jgi:hypothetical protein